MVIAVLDLLTHGREYAKMCIANAKGLAESFHDKGCEVFQVKGKDYTNSQYVALFLQQLMAGEILSQNFWKYPSFSPAEFICPYLQLQEDLTQCVWELSELHVGECVRKI